tara:strand:- start:18485 stop:18982 length:498 start_codon:yes stop_codon:yes gene_type:complete
MDYNYLKSTGSATTFVDQSGERHMNKTDWNVDYDGKIADVQLDMTTDGERDKLNIVLDNKDLAKILNVPSVKKPLEERLYDDFLVDQKVYKMNPKTRRHVISVKRGKPLKIIKLKKRRRHKKTKKSKKSKKSSRRTPRPKTKRIHLSKRSSRSKSSRKTSKSRRS